MSEPSPHIQALLPQIRALINSARRMAARAIDTLQVSTNFEIGRLIVEHEQEGKERAAYGRAIIAGLAVELTDEFGRGFSKSNLEYMRRFFLAYRDRPHIAQTPSGQSPGSQIAQTVSGQLQATLSAQSTPGNQGTTRTWALGWSHYLSLLSISNADERRFYEIEAISNNWSVRELERQINSSLYERLALSRDKDEIARLAREGQIVDRAADLLKNPLVLEFLDLQEHPHYSESDLEQAIIDKLEHFLLELGKGFLFEARQKRFSFDNDHFYVDLVFYNRLLRCYVLIDLKRDKLTHQDLGQMQMYVNYFDRHVKTDSEAKTIGMVLCHRKNDALVELTLPKDSTIHAAEYQMYVPSKEELRAKLVQWVEEGEG